MSSKAQSLAAPDGEGSGIAVFNGNIEDVPDGTVVNFWYPENGDYIGESLLSEQRPELQRLWAIPLFVASGGWRTIIRWL